MFKIEKRGIIAVVSVLVLLLGLCFVGCSTNKTKEFTIENEIKVTLTPAFSQEGTFDDVLGIRFRSKDANVQVFKTLKSDLDDFAEMNLTEFAYAESKKTILYDKENELCFTEEHNRGSNYSKRYYFNTPTAYYMVSFIYTKSNDERIHNWAKSVKIPNTIYNIDESMTDTKRIFLTHNDTATMEIGTDYILCRHELPTLYQKMQQTASVYIDQCEIQQVAKASGTYASLYEYAAANASGKSYRTAAGNVICQYYNGFSWSEKTDYIEFDYYLESDKFYYMVSFLSTHLSYDEMCNFDQLANTFQK